MKKLTNMYMLLIALAAITQLQAGTTKEYAKAGKGQPIVTSEVVGGAQKRAYAASGTLGGTPVYSHGDDGTVASKVVSGGPSEGRQGGIEGEGSGGTGQKETSNK